MTVNQTNCIFCYPVDALNEDLVNLQYALPSKLDFYDILLSRIILHLANVSGACDEQPNFDCFIQKYAC